MVTKDNGFGQIKINMVVMDGVNVDGTLYLCLGQDDKVDLRALMRAGCNDVQLEREPLDAIGRKPLKYEFREHSTQVVRFMLSTGG